MDGLSHSAHRTTPWISRLGTATRVWCLLEVHVVPRPCHPAPGPASLARQRWQPRGHARATAPKHLLSSEKHRSPSHCSPPPPRSHVPGPCPSQRDAAQAQGDLFCLAPTVRELFPRRKSWPGPYSAPVPPLLQEGLRAVRAPSPTEPSWASGGHRTPRFLSKNSFQAHKPLLLHLCREGIKDLSPSLKATSTAAVPVQRNQG